MTATATPTAAPGAQGCGVRRYRLTGTGAFEALFREGRRSDGTWLQLIAAPARATPGQVGYVIGKKVLRRAVDRNRIRRVLREAVRRARPAVEAYDVIVRLKRGCARHEAVSVAAEATLLLVALIDDDGRIARQ